MLHAGNDVGTRRITPMRADRNRSAESERRHKHAGRVAPAQLPMLRLLAASGPAPAVECRVVTR